MNNVDRINHKWKKEVVKREKEVPMIYIEVLPTEDNQLLSAEVNKFDTITFRLKDVGANLKDNFTTKKSDI